MVIVILLRVSVASTVEYLKSVIKAKLKQKLELIRKVIYKRCGIL